MEPTSNVPPKQVPNHITRGRLIRLVALIMLASGLTFWWYRLRPPEPPVLPSVPLHEMEPAVVAAITKGMDRVRKEPSSANSWGFLGQVLMAHSCDRQAEVCFERAFQLDPRQPRWLYLRYFALQVSDKTAALPLLERAVEMFDQYEPESTSPRLVLVGSLLDRGMVDEADRQLALVEKREPDNPLAIYDRGVIEFRRNHFEQSVDCFLRVAEYPSCRKKTAAQLALIYQILKDPQRARAFSDKARTAPDDEQWFDPYLNESFSLGVDSSHLILEAARLEKQGLYREAAALLEESALRSKSKRSELLIATNLAQQERFEEAVEKLKKLLDQESDNNSIRYNLGVSLYYWGERLRLEHPHDPSEAMAKFRASLEPLRKSIEIKPDQALAHTFLGLSLWRLEQKPEAMKQLREGVRLQPVDMLTHWKLAQTLEEQGALDEALKEYELAQRYADKEDPRAQRGIESVRAKLNQKSK
jgi:tetratricopeptide (TPR) repeat protein